MSDNDQASEDTANNDAVNETVDENPFKESTPEKEEAPVAPKAKAPAKEVTGDTDDSINASLDELKDVDVLKSMVTRLRHENGNHRKQKKELTSEIDRLKTDVPRLRKTVEEAIERAERAEARAKSYVIKLAAEEYEVDEELVDLIDGNDDEEIYTKAARLANTKKRKPAYETAPTYDPFARRAGRPVKPEGKDPGGEYLRDLLGS